MTEQPGAQPAHGGTDTDTDAQDPAPGPAPDPNGDSTSTASETQPSGSTQQTGSTQQPRSERPSEPSTEQIARPGVPAKESTPRGRAERAPWNVGETIWKVSTIVAAIVRVIAYLLALALVASIVLTIVGVNTANSVAQVIGAVAENAVLGFRDLFLLADPLLAYLVNHGLAAIFWVLVAEFGARLVRWVGARVS